MLMTFKIAAFTGVILTSLFGPDRIGLAGTQQQAGLEHSARGGIVSTADGFRFEVLFFPTGARVFPLDSTGSPVNTSQLVGNATFYHPNAPGRPWFSRPLHPETTAAGQSPTSLDLIIGLSKAPQKGAAVVFEITGLPARSGSPVTFKVPLEFVTTSTPVATAPEGSAAAQPRYMYGPGAYGYGYYAYPGPETLPQPTASAPTYSGTPTYTPTYSRTPTYYGTRDPMAGHTVGSMHKDWTTGRSSPLAKPWLRPMD